MAVDSADIDGIVADTHRKFPPEERVPWKIKKVVFARVK